jgi:1-acyl-sn-glycerol-3-phosphate acyltransferase
MRQNVNRQPFVALHGALKLVLRPALVAFKRLRVENGAHLPDGLRPCIVICNHAAWVDSVYLSAAVGPRLTICGARPAYFASTWRRWLMATANILRVDGREQFVGDCVQLIRQGHTLLIYPEMGRHPDGLGEFESWAAEVALASAAPVVPCYLYGTTRGHGGAVRLIVGAPILPEGNAEGLTRRFREAVSALAPRARTSGGRPT